MFNAETLSVNLGRWLPFLLDAALKSALVSAAALVALMALRRSPAATRHLALLAGLGILLGLPALMLLLPRQALPSLAPETRAVVVNAAPPPALTAPMAQAPGLPTNATPIAPAAALPPPVPPIPSPIVAPASAPPSPIRPVWIVAAWLLGVLVCMGRMLAAQARVWRLTRRCPPLSLPAPAPSGFAALKSGSAGTPPMVWGWPRATLLLPPESAIWPAARLRAVLLHEAAHVRRQDWLTQTLTQAACALYWFNPLVWLLAARLQSEAERAADDAVLLAGVPPADYASDLLAVARALGAGGRQRRASTAAVTMARRSPVRGRLEAILDARRPRRRLTRRSAGLAFAAALVVAAPLAALRPAARADEAPASQTAPAPGVPTEADLARVRLHLQSLEEARAEYGAAHPNTLTTAQIAQADELTYQADLKRGRDRFTDREAAAYAWAKVESKKPHNMQERKEIWRTIFSYEHRPPRVIKEEHDFALYFARLKSKVGAFPAEQVTRESRLYAFDSDIALSRTRAEAMQMERAEGYPLHFSEDEITAMRDLGFHSEKSGQTSCADTVRVFLLDSKLRRHNPLDDADIDSLIAILRQSSETPSLARMDVIGIFRRLPSASAAQQQKICTAVMPLLTSQDAWERRSAEHILKKFAGGAPTPPAQKAQAVPAPPHQTTQRTAPPGVSPMTPRIILKPMLLKMAAFTALAAGLTPPAAQAEPPAPAPNPAVPALAAGGLHWETIILQHTTLGAVRTLTGWGRGGALPEGVSRVYFLESNGSILFQTTPAGSAHMREAVRAIETAPQPVQIKFAAATVTAAEMSDPSLHFDRLPADGTGVTGGAPRGFIQAATGGTAAYLAALTGEEGKVFQSSVLAVGSGREVTVSLPDGTAAPDSERAELGVTTRRDGGDSFTLQIRLTRSQGALTGGAQEITIRHTLKKGETLVLVNPIPGIQPAKGHYLLLLVTPTVVTGVEPTPAR